MISIHDVIAFIEYEVSFQSADSADLAGTLPKALPRRGRAGMAGRTASGSSVARGRRSGRVCPVGARDVIAGRTG